MDSFEGFFLIVFDQEKILFYKVEASVFLNYMNNILDLCKNRKIDS